MSTITSKAMCGDYPDSNFNYYKGDIYWNDFEFIRCHINSRISGLPHINWEEHLKTLYSSFDSAFFLNCGNGWVERDLFRLGIIKRASGVDIGAGMIEEARTNALNISMEANYSLGDINTVEIMKGTYDLVVNHAAMHHVAYINRVTYRVAKSLKPNGKYVGFDYIGPHRNQYSWEAWRTMVELNAKLPERFRAKLIYPHMGTMLHTDPTEAIHSELQLGVLKRYFDIVQYSDLGGGIAYQMLLNNTHLFHERQTTEGIATLELILDADIDFVNRLPECSLFGFWIATPKKDFPHLGCIKEWCDEEDVREAAGKLNAGRYYPATALEIIYNELADLNYQISILASV